MQEKNYLKTPQPPGGFNSQIALSLGATFLMLVILPVTFFMLKSRQTVSSEASSDSLVSVSQQSNSKTQTVTKGISGMVFLDRDGNGLYSAATDLPQANLGVVARSSQGELKAVTNKDGVYVFDALPLDTYSFVVESPETHKILTKNGLTVILSPNSLSLTLLDIPLTVTQ